MRKPKIYISGAITKDPNYLQKFERVESMLRQFGLDPINPCKLPHPPESTDDDYLRLDCAALATCDSMYLMPDWRGSEGCEIEIKLARMLNIEIITFGNLTKFFETKLSEWAITPDGTLTENIKL